MDFQIRDRSINQGRRRLTREREAYLALVGQGVSSREACRIVGIDIADRPEVAHRAHPVGQHRRGTTDHHRGAPAGTDPVFARERPRPHRRPAAGQGHDRRRSPPSRGAIRPRSAGRSTDLAVHSRDHLDAVAVELNSRARKTLGWDTPAERMATLLDTNI
jgi:hypothetical protein